MSFIKPMNVLYIQQELKEYERLCAEYNYSPAKEEFEDIVQFILLQQGGQSSGTMCESISEIDMNYLFENFNGKIELLLEYTGGDGSGNPLTADGKAELDSAVGLAKTVAGGAVAGAAAVGAGALLAGAKIGSWISYMFKKGKVKKSANKEYDAANTQLNDYIKIYQLKLKKAELEGKEAPKGDFPGYPA